MVFVSVLAIVGIFMAAVPAVFVVGVFGAVFAVAFLLDEVKIWFFQKTRILGGSNQIPPKSSALAKFSISHLHSIEPE